MSFCPHMDFGVNLSVAHQSVSNPQSGCLLRTFGVPVPGEQIGEPGLWRVGHYGHYGITGTPYQLHNFPIRSPPQTFAT
jgi:hypothetical protein